MEIVLLNTARLTLRNLREPDFDAVFAYRSDPRLCRYTGEPMSKEQTAAHIAGSTEGWSRAEGEALKLAVELRSECLVIGEAMIRYLSVKQRQAELGLALHPRRHEGRTQEDTRRFLATEAIVSMMRYCFEELRAHRVVGFIDVENGASLRLADSLGMRNEGLLRENILRHGEWRDEYLVSLLEGEWPALKQRFEHLLAPG